MKAIYGLYPDPDSAERALDVLEQLKSRLEFSETDIAVLTGEPYEEYGFGGRDRKTPMPWLAALGGLVAALGGVGLVWFGQHTYPLVTGGMSIVPYYPLGIITYELAMLGAVLTTVITLLVTARLPDWRRDKLYDPAVSHGKILVGVINPPEKGHSELRETLHAAGAEAVKEIADPR